LKEAELKNEIQITEMQKKKEEDKFNKVIGKWMFIIAGIILCVNVFCRITDAVKSMDYIQVVGTVDSVDVRTEWTYVNTLDKKS